MNAPLVVVGSLAGLFLLDRLLLRMERRGWIHYRRSRGSSGALANSLLEMQALLEPAKRHVVEERRRDDAGPEEIGDGPSPEGAALRAPVRMEDDSRTPGREAAGRAALEAGSRRPDGFSE